MGQGRALPLAAAKVGKGSTAVHPGSCANWQQWVVADLHHCRLWSTEPPYTRAPQRPLCYNAQQNGRLMGS